MTLREKLEAERETRRRARAPQAEPAPEMPELGPPPSQPPEAVRRERFRRVAERRVQQALRAMRLLGNCANVHTYSYTEAESSQLILALTAAVRDLDRKFHPPAELVFKFQDVHEDHSQDARNYVLGPQRQPDEWDS